MKNPNYAPIGRLFRRAPKSRDHSSKLRAELYLARNSRPIPAALALGIDHRPLPSIRFCLRHLRSRVLAVSFAALGTIPALAVEHIFPSDSGVVNMRTDLVSLGIHPSNATGNGVTDDRAAIQAAINWAIGNNGRYHTAKFLYFPNGTYLIRDTIQSRVSTSGFSQGWRAGMILIGQSQAGTILKLANNASGFTDAATRKSMIITGSENPNNDSEGADGSGNEAFRHQIHNLTVDTGSGNIGAVAVDFNASNRGSVRDVLIRSSDSQNRGLIGLELRKNGDGVGPLLIKNVVINGFDTGILGNNSTYSSTFENVTLNNQKVVGINPGGSMFTFRNLISNNSVPVLAASKNLAHVAIVGATVSGGASGNTAFINSGKLFLRDIQSSGYGTIVDNNSGGSPDVSGGSSVKTLNEFSSHNVETLFPNTGVTSLRLPIEETPTYENNDFSQWANVEDYGATNNNSSDDTAGIQAAIDSGKRVVYLPNGSYNVSGPIYIRNNVRKIVGFESKISTSSGFSAAEMIRFDSNNTVILRNLSLFGKITHNSSGSLALYIVILKDLPTAILRLEWEKPLSRIASHLSSDSLAPRTGYGHVN